jgi:hypothetical protein
MVCDAYLITEDNDLLLVSVKDLASSWRWTFFFPDQLEISQVLIDQLIVRTIKISQVLIDQIYAERWTKRIKTRKKTFKERS